MILILNQFPEKDPAPTSRYLKEWGEDLRQQGESIQWISGTPSYRLRSPLFIFRALQDLQTVFLILWEGIWSPTPHLIIASSSPPGILLVATVLKLWHRVPLIHWAMDLHPDLSEALGENKFLRGIFQFFVKRCYPLCDVLLTLDADMQKKLRTTYQVDSIITRLWPLNLAAIPDSRSVQSPPRWIYSGNLGKAHEWKTVLETQSRLEQQGSPFQLRLQGNASQRLPSNLSLPQQIELSDYVAEENLVSTLLSCHLLIATQNPLTTGLLWPCKLALLSVLPRPLLWIGSKNSSTATEFKQRPHTGIFEPGESEKIAQWIKQYETIPNQNDFKKWIEKQPTQSAFLEQVRKVTLPLRPKAASRKDETDESAGSLLKEDEI